jgi:hypothetical protein
MFLMQYLLHPTDGVLPSRLLWPRSPSAFPSSWSKRCKGLAIPSPQPPARENNVSSFNKRRRRKRTTTLRERVFVTSARCFREGKRFVEGGVIISKHGVDIDPFVANPRVVLTQCQRRINSSNNNTYNSSNQFVISSSWVIPSLKLITTAISTTTI